MNKEEILEKSRKENKNRDLEYIEAENKSKSLAFGAALIAAFVLFFFEYGVMGNLNASLWIVFAIGSLVHNISLYVKLKNKKFLIVPLITLVMLLILAAVAVWAYLL